jgi:ferredoxin
MCEKCLTEVDDKVRDVSRPFIYRFFSRYHINTYEIFVFLSRYAKTPVIGIFIRWLGNRISTYYQLTVVPLDVALDAIDKANFLTIGDCPCRKVSGNCDPHEMCIFAGKAAETWKKYSKLNLKRISKKQAREHLIKNHKKGMINIIAACTTRDIYSICSCCRCCCLGVKFYLDCGIKKSLKKSPYIAHLIHDELGVKCSNCGACVKVCQEFFGARSIKNGKVIFDESKCMGCGRCIEVCKRTKIKTKRKPEFKFRNYEYKVKK